MSQHHTRALSQIATLGWVLCVIVLAVFGGVTIRDFLRGRSRAKVEAAQAEARRPLVVIRRCPHHCERCARRGDLW